MPRRGVLRQQIRYGQQLGGRAAICEPTVHPSGRRLQMIRTADDPLSRLPGTVSIWPSLAFDYMD